MYNFTDLQYQGPTVDFKNRKVYWRLTTLYEYLTCPKQFFLKRVEGNASKHRPHNTPGQEYLDKGMVVHHLIEYVLNHIYNEMDTLEEISRKNGINIQLSRYCNKNNIILTEEEKNNIRSVVLDACNLILEENVDVESFESQLIYECSKDDFSYAIKIVPDIVTESKIIEIKTTNSQNVDENSSIHPKHELQHKLYRDYYKLYSESIVCNIATGKVFKKSIDNIIPGEAIELVEKATKDVLDEKFDKTNNTNICSTCRIRSKCKIS